MEKVCAFGLGDRLVVIEISKCTAEISGAAGKVYVTAPGALGPYAAAESGIPSPKQFSSSFDNHGLGPKMHKARSMEAFSSAPSVDLPFYKGTLGKALEHEGGILHTSANANNTVQVLHFPYSIIHLSPYKWC